MDFFSLLFELFQMAISEKNGQVPFMHGPHFQILESKFLAEGNKEIEAYFLSFRSMFSEKRNLNVLSFRSMFSEKRNLNVFKLLR